ncbi:CBO0543 family protein [Paenibacillus sinopodophylli]|uniref:CBO0543 family protein n=1 Tax=Paenibacillus sinopodophylli TaxID=1837342 RepID=UPI00110CE130|nr:CBO0543 family protein [Paenibacillus sinopodophylli]
MHIDMMINIICGLIIPWLAAIPLIRKKTKLLLLIFPIGAVVSMVINSLGFQMNFWDFTPFIPNDESVSAMPLDLGLYPVLGSYMIWAITLRKSWTAAILLLFILFTTLLEYIALLCGKVSYGNGWNIGHTFLSYLLAFGLVYLYFKLLARFRML